MKSESRVELAVLCWPCPSLTLRKLALSLSRLCSKGTGPNPHGRARPLAFGRDGPTHHHGCGRTGPDGISTEELALSLT